MKITDYTPDYYVEKKWLGEILKNLEDIETSCIIRDQKEVELPKEKYISIITSTEQHNYTPPEYTDDNCIAVFMNYPPVKEGFDAYDTNGLLLDDKMHALPLGYHKDFDRGFPIKKMEDREIDVCFVGQLDPYRRRDFYNECVNISKIQGLKTFFHFYEGWNKGFSMAQYQEILNNTKIALVPWGSASRNTFRFWEAYYSGCTIFSYHQYRTWYNQKDENSVLFGERFFYSDGFLYSKSWMLQRIRNNFDFKIDFTEQTVSEYIRKVINEQHN